MLCVRDSSPQSVFASSVISRCKQASKINRLVAVLFHPLSRYSVSLEIAIYIYVTAVPLTGTQRHTMCLHVHVCTNLLNNNTLRLCLLTNVSTSGLSYNTNSKIFQCVITLFSVHYFVVIFQILL